MAPVSWVPTLPDPSARPWVHRRLFWGAAACVGSSEPQAGADWTVANANLACLPEKKRIFFSSWYPRGQCTRTKCVLRTFLSGVISTQVRYSGAYIWPNHTVVFLCFSAGADSLICTQRQLGLQVKFLVGIRLGFSQGDGPPDWAKVLWATTVCLNSF